MVGKSVRINRKKGSGDLETHYGKNYYSLKVGHTMPRNIQKRFKVTETGGGYLGIKYLQNTKLRQHKRRYND